MLSTALPKQFFYFLLCKTIQPWLWIWNALHVSAHQANITQWQGQRPGETGRDCICCYCHSYPLAHPPLIRCLDNCDLDTHCWWSDITQTQAYFSPRYSPGIASHQLHELRKPVSTKWKLSKQYYLLEQRFFWRLFWKNAADLPSGATKMLFS